VRSQTKIMPTHWDPVVDRISYRGWTSVNGREKCRQLVVPFSLHRSRFSGGCSSGLELCRSESGLLRRSSHFGGNWKLTCFNIISCCL